MGQMREDCFSKGLRWLGAKKCFLLCLSLGSQGILETYHHYKSLDKGSALEVNCTTIYIRMDLGPNQESNKGVQHLESGATILQSHWKWA
jgi:hypothetical protein